MACEKAGSPWKTLSNGVAFLLLSGKEGERMAGKRIHGENNETAELKKQYKELQARVNLLESSERRLAALNDISNLITQTLETKEILVSVTERIADMMGVEVVLVFLVNYRTYELELLAHRGVSQGFVAAMEGMKVSEGFNGEVAASGEAIVVEDTSRDPRLSAEEVLKEGLHAQLIVPLKFKDRGIGTLCVSTRQPRQFQPEEVELLTAIGNEIGVAVENARLYQVQKQTAAELQASERKYRTLFESANDAIWVHDLDGNFLAVNQACADLTECTIEQLSHMNVRSFLRDNGLALARKVRDKLLRSEATNGPYEQVFVRKDGTEVILRLSTSLITADGKPTAFQHIARDVTEEKRVQQNLRYHLQQVVKAQEEERKRIARELHDDTAQILGSLSREVDNFVRKKSYLLPDEVAFLKYMREQLNHGLQEVHRFSQDLRPSIIDDLGLSPALKSLVNKMKEHNGIDVELELLGNERRFTPEAELLLFRIVQEALSNIRKHAQASAAWVEINFAEGTTRVAIRDNGHGFELPARTDDFLHSGRLGLAGMQERAWLLGGTLEVQSTPGGGTTITVEIPS